MKWLEIIVVRTGGTVDPPVQLLKQIAGPSMVPGLREALVYSNASIPGDLAITLTWETDKTNLWGSDLAAGLIQELRRVGLVDHSIWITPPGMG